MSLLSVLAVLLDEGSKPGNSAENTTKMIIKIIIAVMKYTFSLIFVFNYSKDV